MGESFLLEDEYREALLLRDSLIDGSTFFPLLCDSLTSTSSSSLSYCFSSPLSLISTFFFIVLLNSCLLFSTILLLLFDSI